MVRILSEKGVAVPKGGVAVEDGLVRVRCRHSYSLVTFSRASHNVFFGKRTCAEQMASSMFTTAAMAIVKPKLFSNIFVSRRSVCDF